MTGLGTNIIIGAFCRLGEIIDDALSQNTHTPQGRYLSDKISSQVNINPWFTPDSVKKSLGNIRLWLYEQQLTEWLEPYDLDRHGSPPFSVGVIMAGNIPLVGFHDFLSVLITGNRFIGSCSSKDPELLVVLSKLLSDIEPDLAGLIEFRGRSLSGIEAVIATGSDNSARYFEYNYGKLPHIFRHNRNGIAIIDPSTSDNEIKLLGNDVFDYFGLGCRSVSKLYLPPSFDIERPFNLWSDYSNILSVKPYRDNYLYHRSLYKTQGLPFDDQQFFILQENNLLNSPVSVLFYERYTSREKLEQQLSIMNDNIQLVVGKDHVPFGKSQSPLLSTYADNIDTLQFLTGLISSLSAH